MRELSPRAFKTIPGKSYATPKEIWGFRSDRGTGGLAKIAHEFLDANQAHLKITSALARLRLTRVVHGLGADHVIFQQFWRRRRIHRGYVTVHIGRGRRVYLVKSRAVPDEVLGGAEKSRVVARRAVRAALARGGRGRGRAWVVGKPELLWYPA